MLVAGVDGTRGGWVAIVLNQGEVVADHLLPVDTCFEELADAASTVFMTPIGVAVIEETNRLIAAAYTYGD